MPYYKKDKKGAKAPKSVTQTSAKSANKNLADMVYKLQKQLGALQTATKPEKKYKDQAEANLTFGQVRGHGNGFLATIISPEVQQGVGESQRIGASIHWTSGIIKMQFIGQVNMISKVKGRVEMWRLNGSPVSDPEQEVTSIYKANPFLSGGDGQITDMHSQRNEDFLKRYTKVMQRDFIIGGDTFGDDLSGNYVQPLIKYMDMPYKFKTPKELTYADSGSNSVTHNQHILIFMLNSGNASASTASDVEPIANGDVQSGCAVSYTHRAYYTDA